MPLNGTGFSSGFIPTADSPSGVLFAIVVPDTKPIWFYCAQTTGNHCQKVRQALAPGLILPTLSVVFAWNKNLT